MTILWKSVSSLSPEAGRRVRLYGMPFGPELAMFGVYVSCAANQLPKHPAHWPPSSSQPPPLLLSTISPLVLFLCQKSIQYSSFAAQRFNSLLPLSNSMSRAFRAHDVFPPIPRAICALKSSIKIPLTTSSDFVAIHFCNISFRLCCSAQPPKIKLNIGRSTFNTLRRPCKYTHNLS